MKYIWIVMILIADLVWCMYSVKDFIYCLKHYTHPLKYIDVYTYMFIKFNIVGLFALSLIMWLIAKIG